MGHISEDQWIFDGEHRPEQFWEALKVAGGYGGDPTMTVPAVPWPKTLSEDDRKLIAALADTILPGTARDPAPSAMGITDFFDEWLSAPYPDYQKDRTQLLAGFALLQQESQTRFGRKFERLSGAKKRLLVDWLFQSGDPARAFFARFRSLLVGGYFTSDKGMLEIGYIGNVPLKRFPGVSPEAMAIIETQLRKRGL